MAERTAVTTETAMNRGIFSLNGETGIAGHHDVVQCIPASSSATRRHVSEHLGPRCLHIPIPARDGRMTPMGILITASGAALREAHAQVDYVRAMSGLPLTVVTPHAIQEAQTAYIVPYLRTPQEEQDMEGLGRVELHGLPGVMTAALKNKASSHELLDRYGSDRFRVADYRVVEINDIVQNGKEFLATIRDGYQEIGLLNAYDNAGSIGIVLRAAEGDGGYGNCILRKSGSMWTVTTEAVNARTHRFDSQEKALAFAQRYFVAEIDQSVENRIVMSRLIDKADSPGMSVIIQDDHTIPLRWNGQLQQAGRTACEGTSVYDPKDYSSRKLQDEFEGPMADELDRFLRWVAKLKGVKFEDIRAFLGIDFLIPSELEFLQQRRRKQQPHLPIVEFNPRLTEFTDALMGATLFNRHAQTPHGLLEAREMGVHTLTNFPLPSGIDPRYVREELAYRYQERGDHGLVVVRVAPVPVDGQATAMPVAVYGDLDTGMRELRSVVDNIGQK